MTKHERLPYLSTTSLGKRVPSPEGELVILDDITLSIAPGESLAIVGASGSGKSTLLGLMAGLDTASHGNVVLDGHDLGTLDEDGRASLRASRVGFVFQSFQLLPSLTALENVMLPLELASRADPRRGAEIILDRVGLGDRLQHYPKQLSGGEQQRVAIARALAPQPLMLLLDEPFSNLDPEMTIKMRKELYRVLRQTQTTAILVTHDHEEAFAMADEVAVMQDGGLVQCDTPEKIYQQPSCSFVAEFIGQANTIPGIIKNGQIETEIGTFPNHSDYHSESRVLVMLRPNDIQFTPSKSGSGRIESRQFQGSHTLYAIRLKSGQLIHCCMVPIPVYNIETSVTIQVTTSHTILFPQPALS